jgi:hypothetical protein
MTQKDGISQCLAALDGIMTAVAYGQDDKVQLYVERLSALMIGHTDYQRTLRHILSVCAVFTRELYDQLRDE